MSRSFEWLLKPALLTSLICFGAGMACTQQQKQELGPMPNPPVPPGTELDKSSDYHRYWPQGRPALFKLKDNLILAIPPQYQQFWYQRDKVVRAPAAPSAIPQVPLIGFDFFMPGFSGYTPENYRRDFDENKVDVVELEPADLAQTAPDTPGEYPPNMLKRALGSILDPNNYKDIYGLRCYRWLSWIAGGRDRMTCYGRRDDSTGEDIMFYANTPPYEPGTRFPLMQAEYFSKRYGGLRIVWRTHVTNLPRWRDIDTQIWKFIDSWNIAKTNNPSTAR